MNFKLIGQLLLLCSLTLTACAKFDTRVKVAEKPLPANFPQVKAESTASTLADINWRQYFNDPMLQSLLDGAVKNNIDLQTALLRIEKSRSSIKLANAALLPQINLNVGGGIRKFGLYTMDGAGNATTEIRPGQIVPENLPDIYLGLQTAWEIDVWGKLQSQRKSAIAEYLASKEGANLVISNLIADTAIHYHELLALDHELDIVRQTIQKQKQALEIIEAQKEAGRANRLAVEQFKAQLLSTQALEKKVLQQSVEIENQINFLLGRYPQPIRRSKENLLQPMPPLIATGIPSQLLANRPDIREAEYQIQASRFDVLAAKAAFYPNFTITANAGFQAFNPEFLFSSPASIAYSFMGNMIAPIINMESLKAKFHTAKANQLSAIYNYQRTILTAYVEVVNELSNIKNLEQINILKKEQSEVLQDSIETSNELYKAARASYLEVLTAQQNALQARLELIDVYKRQRLSMINVYKALGGGWR